MYVYIKTERLGAAVWETGRLGAGRLGIGV